MRYGIVSSQRSISHENLVDHMSGPFSAVGSPLGSTADSAFYSACSSEMTTSESLANMSISSKRKSKKSSVRSMMSGLVDLVSSKRKSSANKTLEQKRKTSAPVISLSNCGVAQTSKAVNSIAGLSAVKKSPVTYKKSAPLIVSKPQTTLPEGKGYE